MNKYLTIALLAAALLAPAAFGAPAAATNQPALNPIQSEMRTIVEGINSKVKDKQGKVTAADLADDIKAFDALLAKHTGEKTDELARVEFEPDHTALIVKRAKRYSAEDLYVFRICSTGVFLFADRLILVSPDDTALFTGKPFVKVQSLS